MTSRDLVYWLQGYFEILGESKPLTVEQADCIKRHLAMVFRHEIDPSMGDKKHQEELTKIHNIWPNDAVFMPLTSSGGTLVRC